MKEAVLLKDLGQPSVWLKVIRRQTVTMMMQSLSIWIWILIVNVNVWMVS
jgi:hypothetical protein